MTDWKRYKIVGKDTDVIQNSVGDALSILPVKKKLAIKFKLDNYVRCECGNQQYIYCVDDSSFNDWNVNDYVEIDNDSNSYIFHSDSNAIRFVGSSSSMALVSVQNQTTILQQRCSDLVEKDQIIELGKRELEKIQKERDEYKKEVKRLTDLSNNLQIANNSKDQAIKGLKDDITKKDKEIIALEARLGEGVLNKKITSEEKELDNLVRTLVLSRSTVMNLCSAYRKLEFSTKVQYTREKTAEAENEIERIKQELFTFATEKQIDNDNLYKVYYSCKQIAKWKIELEQLYQKQYQARQEQPTNQ